MLGSIPLISGPFVAVDIETTGPRPGSSSIIDIGAVRVVDGRIVGYFSTLVTPQASIPAAIEQLTGISNTMVVQAPSVADAITQLRTFAQGAVFIAHGHRFDMSFLDYEAERLWGKPLPRPILDTLTLARRLHPELRRHNLRELSDFYNTGALPNHRALPDALATAELFVRMVPELSAQGLATAGQVATYCGSTYSTNLASKLPLATHIPDVPGVYWFRNSTGTVVLVGRARNLRTRIRGHFYALGEAATGPAAETTSISYVPCVSGLDAALLETRLQARYSSTLGHRINRPAQPVYLHVNIHTDYPAFRITHKPLGDGPLIGPFSNEHHAHVLVDVLNSHFGLRRCQRTVQHCANRPCSAENATQCPAPDIYALGPASYARSLNKALAVFNGGAQAFRETLRLQQEEAATAERFERASQCRDAIRALDRALSALAITERATANHTCLLIEGDEHSAAIIVVVNGWLFTTIRANRSQVASGRCSHKIAIAVTRASRHTHVAQLSARQYQDIVTIDAYRQQHDLTCIPYLGCVADTAAQAMSALRRMMRIPRKRHEAVSTV